MVAMHVFVRDHMVLIVIILAVVLVVLAFLCSLSPIPRKLGMGEKRAST
jgi:hypothetical protein